MPSAPPSRPRPDIFQPPNGAAAFETTPTLRPTVPSLNEGEDAWFTVDSFNENGVTKGTPFAERQRQRSTR